MKNEKTVSFDYSTEDFDQLDIKTINIDIKEWLMEDSLVYKDFYKEVTREEELKSVKEHISDLMIER